MDVRIGIADSPQTLDVQMADDADRDALRKQIDDVLSGNAPVLTLEDRKGKELSVPASRVAFVEIGAASGDRRIGFGA